MLNENLEKCLKDKKSIKENKEVIRHELDNPNNTLEDYMAILDRLLTLDIED